VSLAGRAAAVALIGVTAASVLAGCGGDAIPSASPSSTVSARAADLQAYLTCLGQHGITLPSRSPGARPSFTRVPRPSRSPGADGFGGGFGRNGFGGGFGAFLNPDNPPAGVSASAWSAALSACKSLQPSPRPNAFNNSRITAYRNCLQSHGVTFSAGSGGLSTSNPKVAAALKTCAPLRPTGPARQPATTPSPTPSPTG